MQSSTAATLVIDTASDLPEKHDGATSEPQAVRLWLRLLTCSMTIEKRVRRRLADEFDTTLPRFDVLAALDRSPEGMRMGALSQALLVSGGNLTALVRQIEAQGHAAMRRDPADRRSWIVTITPAGRAHFRAVAAEHHHWVGAMFAGLSAEHADQLYALLAELKASIAADGARG
ncbi:MarR family winged helix-turn-helix transcriptional regulator [Sphingomonas baiyangensis]|uniref:MarR family transcriptional regulator n=1 Tax=Sphingomonas baiyangensis TaxID=2572576 RepID=A0A4U1L359_9SPHN|nr:MarR family transcriptional regulator [Sphingomonas baiyangensis]TKD51327.1 MarR family transcriptional regulator [Sphingomonas baiyangensis]